MIKKAAAILVASIMAMMAVCCVGVSDADDPKVTPLLDMHFDDDTSSMQRTIAVNEGEYYGYSYTLKIYVKGSNDGEYIPVFTREVEADSSVDTSGEVEINEFIITITAFTITTTTETTTETTKVPGVFKLNVNKGDNPTTGFTMNVKVEMIVDIGTVQKTMVPLLYSMGVTIGESESSDLKFVDMAFSVGTYANIQIKESIAENDVGVLSDVSLYHWYAEGLPNGLSLSENGYVSGIPTNSTETNGVDVTIYAFEKDGGNRHEGTLNVNVSEAVNKPEGFKYTVNGIENCKNFVAVTNDEVILTVIFNNSSDDDGVVVKSVDENNESLTLTGTDNKYTLNTEGTGCYKVLLTYTIDGNTEDTQYFHMYVIPSFDNVDAQIVISSS